MEPLTTDEIRASFVNCTKGEAGRLNLPRTLDSTRWEQLDFLGWRDPGAPAAAYLVARRASAAVGVVFRINPERRSTGRQNMCCLCTTMHSTSDVALMVAPRAGAAGRAGNTVGTYVCTDLACSLYARGLQRPARVQPVETLTVEERVARLEENLATFLRRVIA